MLSTSPAASMTTSASWPSVASARASVVAAISRSALWSVSGGAVTPGYGQPMGLQVDADHPPCAHSPCHEVEPESRRSLADDGHILADEIGQVFAGKNDGAQLLGLQHVLDGSVG